MATSSANDLHLVPLGAGDLIDRAVRLYRRHLFTLMRIAAPPVVVSAIGWVVWQVGSRVAKRKIRQNRAKLGAAGVVVLVLLGGVAAARAGSSED